MRTEAGRDHEVSRLFRDRSPVDIFIWGFWPPELGENKFLLF